MRGLSPGGQRAGAGSMSHQSDGSGSGKFGEGGVPNAVERFLP